MSGTFDEPREKILEILLRKSSPDPEAYTNLLERVQEVLDNEDETVRPRDTGGLPGGLVRLKEDIPTLIVPDLHARMDFLFSVFMHEDEGETVLDRLGGQKIQIVCVGDGFHAEGRAKERWALAFDEYRTGFKKHEGMDEEMKESLGVMEMVMEAKCRFPDCFHFLKGNHENIANEEGEGNHPFRKFSYEGIMVLEWVTKFFGEEFISSYYEFEKSLPLLAVGKNFLVSHAEPVRAFEPEEVVEYRQETDVVEGLTWTANDDADPDSVETMLESYLHCGPEDSCYYFGGHRPVRGLYNARAGGRYIQIHNPDRFAVARIRPAGEIDPERDIIEIENWAFSEH
ncbi:MAG: metallophosphoesterase [Spirochaetes bacterium]|nr:metallophosphoesterase [Spirochaetota bacterium]